MKVLLTGANGMLGSAFAAALGDRVITATRANLDLRDFMSFDALLSSSSPDVVINCVAHVDAEAAERDRDVAYAVNSMLPALLAVRCRRAGVTLVHFSSTGCYGAWKNEPYCEEDRVEPTTVHHSSKISGEHQVRDSGCEHLILRVGWLFGGTSVHKKNFVWRRLLEAASTPTLRSDTGQKGCPTFVGDVVQQTLLLLRHGVRGTFNCVSHGEAMRFDYVQRIISAAGVACELLPAGPFPRLAPISPNETAINYRIGLMGLDRMPSWTAAVDRYVAEVLRWPEYRSLTSAGDHPLG